MISWGLTSDAGVVSHAHGADGIIAFGGHFSGTARSMTVGIDQIIARHGILVVIVDVVTSSRILHTDKPTNRNH